MNNDFLTFELQINQFDLCIEGKFENYYYFIAL